MAVRTTVDKVKTILDSTSLSDSTIEGYIDSANVVVTSILSGTTLGSNVLAEIERWLTAHMIAVTRERTAKKQAAGSVSIEYTGLFGASLDSTSYGQMVKALDSSGRMAVVNKRKVNFNAIPQNDG